MRNLILKMSLSIDGFVADVDGGIDWVFGDDPVARAWSVAMVGHAGIHIMGNRTVGDMARYWPTASNPFAPAMNRIPKAVFTRRGAPSPGITQAAATTDGADAGSWANPHVAGGELVDEITALKMQDGAPIVAHGGASFARGLIAAGLVDQFALLVVPVVLGRGLPIFADVAEPRRLMLTQSTAFPGGAVAQIYRVA